MISVLTPPSLCPPKIKRGGQEEVGSRRKREKEGGREGGREVERVYVEEVESGKMQDDRPFRL